MGSAITRVNDELARFNDFYYTAEEKYEMREGISNQRKGAEFAAAYMFYGMPITSKRASTDPISPLWIQVDEAVTDPANPEFEDKSSKFTVPSTVMILATGDITALFRHSGVQYDFTVRDIDNAMNPHAVRLPFPEPPFVALATSHSLTLSWNLSFPGGVTQRVELQYSNTKLGLSKDSTLGLTASTQSEQVNNKQDLQWLALASKSWEMAGLQSHTLDGLGPGRGFVFRIRYWVPRGWSDWSMSSPVSYTLPTVPDCPQSPMLGALLPDAVQLCWLRPRCNGDPVSSFVLRGKGIGDSRQDELDEDPYTELYRGPRLHHLVLRLQPEAAYSFQVAAMNSIGLSTFSLPLSVHTPSRSSKTAVGAGQRALDCAQAWRECWDASTNTPFYFNTITCTRQNERPEALRAMDQDPGMTANSPGSSSVPPEDIESEEQKLERIFRVKRFRFLRTLLGHKQEERPAMTPPSSTGPVERMRVTPPQPATTTTPELETDPITDVMNNSSSNISSSNGKFVLTVRRNCLLWDVFRGLSAASPRQLRGDTDGTSRRRRTRVQFVGEAGIDAGGLAKELFLLASKDLVSLGLRQGWLANGEEGTVYFKAVSPSASQGKVDIQKSRLSGEGDMESIGAIHLCSLLGRLCGLAVLDRQMVSSSLASAVLQQMLTGEGSASLSQLGEMDKALGQSLQWMLQPGNDITDIISETFSVAEPTSTPASASADSDAAVSVRRSMTERRVSLCKGGTQREVTQENKAEYVELVVKWHTCYSAGPLLLTFLQSFHEMVPLSILQTSEILPEELLQILCGRPTVDTDLLRAHAVYQSSGSGTGMTFSASHFLCVWFWTVAAEMEDTDRHTLLRFVTGASSVPVDGLDPPITVTLGEDMEKDSLPRAHTCFNQIVLPMYSSYEKMKSQIEFAIHNTEGFELS